MTDPKTDEELEELKKYMQSTLEDAFAFYSKQK
jgi:hypothetical protein